MASPSPAAAAFAAIADELGSLELELAPHKTKIARAEALRKLLRAAYSGEAADKSFVVDGAKWSIQLGAKGNESVIDTSKLCELVGIEKAFEFAAVTLKALEKASPEIRAAVISTTPTGTRPIHIFSAPAPAPAPKAPAAAVAPAKAKNKRGSAK